MEKKNNSILMIVFVVLIFLGLLGGYFAGYKDIFKFHKEKAVEAKENTKEEIPLKDTFVINGYGDEIHYYQIYNGSVYYMYGNYDTRDIILTHSGCLYENNTDYCKGNPVYSKKADKVEGLSNVVRLKLYNSCHSSGESFSVFAITENGNIYELDKTRYTKVFGDDNVKDMLGQTLEDGSQIEILLKNGEKTIYLCSNPFSVS